MRKKDRESLGVFLFVCILLGAIVQILENFGMLIFWVLVAVGAFFLIKYLVEWSQKTAEEERKLKKKRLLKERKLAEKELAKRREVFLSLLLDKSHDLIATEDRGLVNEFTANVQSKSKRKVDHIASGISMVKLDIKKIIKKDNLPKLASTVEKIDTFLAITRKNYTKEIGKLNRSMTNNEVSYLMLDEYAARVETVAVANKKSLIAALNKFVSLKSKVNAYLLHREKMRIDMIFEKESMGNNSMNKEIMTEINSTGGYLDDLLRSTKVVFDYDEGIKHKDSARSVGVVVAKEMKKKPGLERSQSELKRNNGGKPWLPKGASFQHGTKFQAEHKGRIYSAIVDDGALLVKGKRYTSPSPAANAVTGTSVNGWTFWECQAAGGKSWVKMDTYRKSGK